MKNLRITFTRAVLVLAVFSLSAFQPVTHSHAAFTTAPTSEWQTSGLYRQLHLQELGLTPTAFELAVKGWKKLKAEGQVNNDLLSICDFTQSSVNKRLYVIDLTHQKLLFRTRVAHGKNTGDEFARYFSNEPESNQSSLGFYTTGEPYIGKHGLSLRLQGREKGFNDKAEERAIVIHGAAYVSDDFVSEEGRLGRSWGCPAVSYIDNDKLINTIKDGSCLFIYYPDKKYLSTSGLLK